MDPRSYTCETCGAPFVSSANRGAKFCPDHRRKQGKPRDPAAAARRQNTRKRSKRAGAAAARSGVDLAQSELMAIGLSVYPDAPRDAAAFVGLTITDAKRLAADARERNAELVDGSVDEFSRRSIATLMVIQRKLHTAVLADGIAPRDLPHAGRALSQIHEAIVGKGKQSFNDLSLYLVGADGKPFNPNEVPQPSMPVETEPDPGAPTKH